MRPATSLLGALYLLRGTLLCSAFVPHARPILDVRYSSQNHQACLTQLAASSTASTTANDEIEFETTYKGLLKRDRYVATNRFAVRDGAGPKFEKRWATRKSRLASLEGFQYFHLMRRVTLNEDGTNTYDGGDSNEEAMANYVSFTIWNKKTHFSAWRKSDAFVEAHGGKSIGAFAGALISSFMVLRGPPRPAFYDGLMLQKTAPTTVPETQGGWRIMEADGVNPLPTECFVACNQFFVPPENAAAFEKRWASRESKLKECDGFVAFSMLRRDGQAKGHGTSPVGIDEPSYVSTTIWESRGAFDKWREGQNFGAAHGAGDKSKASAGPPPQKPNWSKPPVPVFYEGTLVITSEDGA